MLLMSLTLDTQVNDEEEDNDEEDDWATGPNRVEGEEELDADEANEPQLDVRGTYFPLFFIIFFSPSTVRFIKPCRYQ